VRLDGIGNTKSVELEFLFEGKKLNIRGIRNETKEMDGRLKVCNCS
jgi:hypothetical protein